EEIVDKINTGDIYHLDQVKTNQYVISEKQVKVKEKPLVFNKKAILNGIIFSEILGKPKGW
ncbi:MAG: hypothetical protein JW708_09875, partial [Vallitaleaceae bacterium]|nr:hypothetical protein [Vallitaleaceae bacterium]